MNNYQFQPALQPRQRQGLQKPILVCIGIVLLVITLAGVGATSLRLIHAFQEIGANGVGYPDSSGEGTTITSATFHTYGSGTINYTIAPVANGTDNTSTSLTVGIVNVNLDDGAPSYGATPISFSQQQGSQSGSGSYSYSGECQLNITAIGQYTITVTNATS